MNSHNRTVESSEFDVLRDAERSDEIARLEPDVGHDESEHHEDARVEELRPELRGVAVQNAAHAVDAAATGKTLEGCPFDAVPSGPVFPICKDADRDDSPDAVGSVHREGSDRVVHLHLVEEQDAEYDEDPGDGTDHGCPQRINERAGRRDR